MIEIFHIAPVTFIMEYLFSVIDGVALAYIAWGMQQLFSKAMLFAEGKIEFEEVVFMLILLLFLYILSEIGNGVCSYFGEIYAKVSEQKLYKKINEKMGKLYALDFETPELLNHIEKAYRGAALERRFVNVLMDIITFYVPYFVIYGIYLYKLQTSLLWIIPLIFLPMMLSQVIKAKIYVDYEEEKIPILRKEQSYISYITERDYIKETRLINRIEYLFDRYKIIRQNRNEVEKKTKRKLFFIQMLSSIIQLLGYIGIIILMINSVFSGKIEISAFAAIIASIGTFTEMMKELISGRLGELSEYYAGIQNYQNFKDMPLPLECQQEEAEKNEISLEHVCFAYPNGKQVLKDINLNIKKNEVLAIVGENGSGKTTLAKLIVGLYLPSSGDVSYSRKKVSNLNYLSLQKDVSAVFQNFGRYYLSLAENIHFNMNKKSEKEINYCLEQSGMELTKKDFPDGVDTILGREFGGIELSGGQWQRVAIARGIYKDSSVIILDEPTAAIDPMREEQLYHTFFEVAKGKTTIMITHRLGLARLCSKIIVLHEGKIKEVGTHEELLSK